MFVEDKSKFAGVEAKPDPFTLEALTAWLRTKDAEQGYCWSPGGHCLFEQYGESLGFGEGSDAYNELMRGYLRCGARTASGGEPFFPVAVNEPHTFGHALARAEALLA